MSRPNSGRSTSKDRELLIIKIVEWAHRNSILVENLTENDIRAAIKSK